MCCDVRCTDRRSAFSSRILARVRAARRSLWTFLFITRYPCLKTLGSDPRSLLLRFLQLDLLAAVAHAFALVGLRRTEGANIGGRLADALNVRTLHQNFGLGGRFEGDALGRLINDRMREAQRQVQVLALDRGAVADADQIGRAHV